jgi:hypothetical protein
MSYDARKKVNRFLWQQFLSDLIGSGEVVSLDTAKLVDKSNEKSKVLERRGTFVQNSIEALHQQSKIRAKNPSLANDHKNSENSAYSLVMHNKKNSILMFAGIWEKNKDQKYADLFYLVHNGIPDELRPRIWKELLKAEIVEVEEINNFKKAYGDQFPYDKTKTLFHNYMMISERCDCLAFKQIDEDVGKFSFGNSYYDN